MMPGLAGAKKRSLDQPYIVAKLNASPLAAEKLIVTDCPGSIRAGDPVPWKVPDSTRGWDWSTFSIVSVPICGAAPPGCPFFLQAANASGKSTAAHAYFLLNRVIIFDFVKRNYSTAGRGPMPVIPEGLTFSPGWKKRHQVGQFRHFI